MTISEWILLIRAGHGFASSEFFMYYFFLTGIHLLHLLIGFITLGVIIYQLRSAKRPVAGDRRDVRHLLAHRRSPVDPHLLVALRGEVTVDAQPQEAQPYNARTRRRSLIVLLILVAITLGYLALDRSGDGHGGYRASSVVTTIAIGLALVKVRFIFRELMQVRNAPVLLCRLTDLWVVVIGATLLTSYFLGRGHA